MPDIKATAAQKRVLQSLAQGGELVICNRGEGVWPYIRHRYENGQNIYQEKHISNKVFRFLKDEQWIVHGNSLWEWEDVYVISDQGRKLI